MQKENVKDCDDKQACIVLAETDDVTDTIVINVGGVRHETKRQALQTLPNSRLAHLNEKSNYRKKEKEYYFDRHPGIFAAILNMYRTGALHMPGDVCGPAFKEELEFWKLDEGQIQECCWIRYNVDKGAKHTLGKLAEKDRKENEEMALMESDGCCSIASWHYVRSHAWLFLEYPLSSRAAKVLLL